jgi:hypothetical protein
MTAPIGFNVFNPKNAGPIIHISAPLDNHPPAQRQAHG